MNDFVINSAVFEGISIPNGDRVVSGSIPLARRRPIGFFSLQLITDGGPVKVSISCSNDDETFSIPVDKDGKVIDDLVVSHASGTGFYGFPPIPICSSFKIEIVALGDVNSLTAILCGQ